MTSCGMPWRRTSPKGRVMCGRAARSCCSSSSTQKFHRIGPRTDPCGAPRSSRRSVDSPPADRARMRRSVSQERIEAIRYAGAPARTSASVTASGEMRANASEKSTSSAVTRPPMTWPPRLRCGPTWFGTLVILSIASRTWSCRRPTAAAAPRPRRKPRCGKEGSSGLHSCTRRSRRPATMRSHVRLRYEVRHTGRHPRVPFGTGTATERFHRLGTTPFVRTLVMVSARWSIVAGDSWRRSSGRTPYGSEARPSLWRKMAARTSSRVTRGTAAASNSTAGTWRWSGPRCFVANSSTRSSASGCGTVGAGFGARNAFHALCGPIFLSRWRSTREFRWTSARYALLSASSPSSSSSSSELVAAAGGAGGGEGGLASPGGGEVPTEAASVAAAAAPFCRCAGGGGGSGGGRDVDAEELDDRARSWRT
mmetsp:Transcript_47817/g.147490  ORF Transcript_47817/g.147490 Transcript_47817/m.147490 type:complete len:424 (-) Transcript_47817:52-1323(-)